MAEQLQRLNKVIADSGLCSRRAADRLIEEGKVVVNGKKVFELGVRVHLGKDKIFVEGHPLKPKTAPVYIIFNKPKGVLTTMEDPLDRPTIKDFIDKLNVRLFPVGRLDWDSEGLLILTNDGDYANKVLNPKNEIPKVYLVKVDGKPEPQHLEKLLNGVTIPGGKVKALGVDRIKRGADQYDWIKIVIDEGKNRQIRYMFEKIGFDVLKLQRVAIGQLKLGSLDRGEWIYMTQEEAFKAIGKPKLRPNDEKPKPLTRKKTMGRRQATRKVNKRVEN